MARWQLHPITELLYLLNPSFSFRPIQKWVSFFESLKWRRWLVRWLYSKQAQIYEVSPSVLQQVISWQWHIYGVSPSDLQQVIPPQQIVLSGVVYKCQISALGLTVTLCTVERFPITRIILHVNLQININYITTSTRERGCDVRIDHHRSVNNIIRLRCCCQISTVHVLLMLLCP